MREAESERGEQKDEEKKPETETWTAIEHHKRAEDSMYIYI